MKRPRRLLPPPDVATIAVFGVSAALALAIRRTLPRPGFRMVRCRSGMSLRRMARSRLLDAIVVAPHGAGSGLVSELAAAHPAIPLVAAGAYRADDGDLLVTCRDAGALLLVDGVDAGAAGELVARHTLTVRRSVLLADAPRALHLVDVLQRQVWELALREVERPLRTAQIARRVGVSREHLSRQFGAGGAPNLKRVVDLARIACAAQLLERPGYSPREISRLLHFTSPSHLGSTTRRIAGVPLSGLAALGPRGTLAAFVRGGMRSR